MCALLRRKKAKAKKKNTASSFLSLSHLLSSAREFYAREFSAREFDESYYPCTRRRHAPCRRAAVSLPQRRPARTCYSSCAVCGEPEPAESAAAAVESAAAASTAAASNLDVGLCCCLFFFFFFFFLLLRTATSSREEESLHSRRGRRRPRARVHLPGAKDGRRRVRLW